MKTAIMNRLAGGSLLILGMGKIYLNAVKWSYNIKWKAFGLQLLIILSCEFLIPKVLSQIWSKAFLSLIHILHFCPSTNVLFLNFDIRKQFKSWLYNFCFYFLRSLYCSRGSEGCLGSWSCKVQCGNSSSIGTCPDILRYGFKR